MCFLTEQTSFGSILHITCASACTAVKQKQYNSRVAQGEIKVKDPCVSDGGSR